MTASPRVRMSWAPRPCPNSAPGPGGWSCRTAQSRRLRCREGAPSRRPQVRLLPGAPSDTALASPQEAKLTDAAPERLWAPSPARIESAGITRYRRWLERERGLRFDRSEEHTSELQSLAYLVCRLLLEKKKRTVQAHISCADKL